VVVSTAAGRGPLLLALVQRAYGRPARPGGGEAPRAATGRSPRVRALSMSTRNGTSWSRHDRVSTSERVMTGNCAGIDWASEKHDVLIEDPAGEQLLGATFAHDEDGVSAVRRPGVFRG
jgi:hypothetical protein